MFARVRRAGATDNIVVPPLADTQTVDGEGGAVVRGGRVEISVLRVDDRVFETGLGGVVLWIGTMGKDSVDTVGVVHSEIEACTSVTALSEG